MRVKRTRAVLLVLLVLFFSFTAFSFVKPVLATTLFSDDFETGNFSVWTATSGSPRIVSALVHPDMSYNGTYAMNVTDVSGSQVYCQETLSADVSLVYTRFYFRIPAKPLSDVVICQFFDPSNNGAITLGINASGILNTAEITTYNNGTHVLSLNTWHCIEFARYYSIAPPSDGWIKVWLDGVIEIDVPNSSYHTNLVHMIRYGKIDTTASFTDYIDCVVIADSYIGPIANVPVYLTITSPTNSTYSGKVPVTMSAVGGTGVSVEWNVQYPNGSFYYIVDLLYTGSTNIVGLTDGSYTFGVYAYNTQGAFAGVYLIDFSVTTPASSTPAGTLYQLTINVVNGTSPVNGARVELNGPSLSVAQYTGVEDSAGYALFNPRPGVYTVTVFYMGLSYTDTVLFNSSEIVTIDISQTSQASASSFFQKYGIFFVIAAVVAIAFLMTKKDSKMTKRSRN
jgi:hypothetical protein